MLELVAMLSLEVNEKEQAPLGQRMRAVGMCFYKKGDLKKGNNYQLRRNRDNPKDTNCFEVRSRHITMATMNMNFSRLLRSLFYSTLKIFMALQKIQLQLYYQQC